MITVRSPDAPPVRSTFKITEAEAVTLRRVAFGESTARSLRTADIDRLLRLGLIADSRDGMILTRSGREHFDTLPRAIFAGRPSWG